MKTFDEALVKDRVNRFPFVKMMGMKLLACGGGTSVMRCRVRRALKNSGGTLHGGVMGVLVDMSVATALRSVLPLTSRMTTVEYKVNLLKPVTDGVITARGSVIRMGKTIAVGTTEIRNAGGDPVAFGSATFYILNVRSPGDSPGIMVATRGRSRPVLKGES
ncbi:PaaI family thioesterase [Candidatus Deferrimicrobium sp.]|uniref:PaaI family thioesterase n=1 Tax=Candidatus Deferrimicrobium sp. TaxID=3060586 RepID=UPI002ED03C9A